MSVAFPSSRAAERTVTYRGDEAIEDNEWSRQHQRVIVSYNIRFTIHKSESKIQNKSNISSKPFYQKINS